MEKARKISAEVYEELKMLSATGEACTLQFRGTNGGLATLHTKITDVFEDEDGQFLLTGDGHTLQLHQLIAINGFPLEHFC